MKVKVKSCGNFVLGSYKKESDAKPVKEFTEEQIMAALNKSKSFNVRNWYGSTDYVKFTIINITKDEYGDYIYTIESSQRINKDYFPSPYELCKGCEDVASPISYSIL